MLGRENRVSIEDVAFVSVKLPVFPVLEIAERRTPPGFMVVDSVVDLAQFLMPRA